MADVREKDLRPVEALRRFSSENSIKIENFDEFVGQKLPNLLKFSVPTGLSYLLRVKFPEPRYLSYPFIPTETYTQQVTEFKEILKDIISEIGWKDVKIFSGEIVGKGNNNSFLSVFYRYPDTGHEGGFIFNFLSEIEIFDRFASRKKRKIDDVDSPQEVPYPDIEQKTTKLLESGIKAILEYYKIPEKFHVELRSILDREISRLVNQSNRDSVVDIVDPAGQLEGGLSEQFARSSKPLCIPEGGIEKYAGKGKSGDIYAFLQNAYPFKEGAAPLTLAYLKELDPKAHRAFYNAQRSKPLPPALEMLRERTPGKEAALIAKYRIDLADPDSASEARQLASAILHLTYRG